MVKRLIAALVTVAALTGGGLAAGVGSGSPAPVPMAGSSWA